MKHTFAIFVAFLIIVFAIASCQPSVILPPVPGKFVGPIGKAGVYPAWASPGGNKFIVSPANIYLGKASVEFTLGSSVTAILEEGQSQTYTLNTVDYEILASSFGTDGQNWEVVLNVNGEDTDALGIGESYTLADNTIISINDIITPGSAMTELSAKDDFIWNKFYTLSNEDQWIEHDVECTVFPDSNWCTNSGKVDIDLDLDTYYDGQNYALGYTCTILPNNQFDCSGGRWKLIWFNLTSGTEPTPTKELCKDSDGGKDYFKQGVVKGYDLSDQPASGTDYCENNGINLTEYFCINSTYVGSEVRACLFGCGSGRCVSETCTDSDGGINNMTAGNATFADMLGIDICKNSTVLEEVYCDETDPNNNQLKMVEITCPNGCTNGACLPG